MFSSMQILIVMSKMVSFEVERSKSSNEVGGSHTCAIRHVYAYSVSGLKDQFLTNSDQWSVLLILHRS